MTDYVIRTDTAITALRNAGETLSDGLLVAMILRGLPESFKQFAIHVTQSEVAISFAEFKTKLWSYKDTEKMRATASEDRRMQPSARPALASASNRGTESVDIVCFRCGLRGHKARACQCKQWYNQCKSTTHQDATCRWKQRWDDARTFPEEASSKEYTLRVSDEDAEIQPGRGVELTDLMVDTGATSHIITDIAKFKKFNNKFQPETHCVELADGTRCKGVAERRGDAEVCLIDSRGQHHNMTLRQALYIPSYPQDIFSVKAATASGATVIFKRGTDALTITQNRRRT